MLLLFIIGKAEARAYKDMGFIHYNAQNSDLPYNLVVEIIQDRKGYMWIGTSSGLSRFDGLRFRNYYEAELGLQSVYVTALATDVQGNVWVGTDLGLSIYDPQKECFTPFTLQTGAGLSIRRKVNNIVCAPDGRMWLSVNGTGLFCYDPADQSLRNYFVKDGVQTLPVNIRTLCVDGQGGLYVSLLMKGLYYIPITSDLPPSLEEGHSIAAFRNDDICGLKAAEDGILYVASSSKGLCRYDRKREALTVLVPLPTLSCVPEELYRDGSGRLWMCTNEGLFCHDPATGETSVLKENPADIFALSDSNVFAVCLDRSDGLWVGTNTGGLNYASAFQKNFEKYYMADGEMLEDCLVRSLAPDGRGKVWVATEKKGLLLFDTKDCSLTKLHVPNLPKTQYSVLYDRGSVWLGTIKGLYRLNPETLELKSYETVGDASKDRRVFALFRTSAGRSELLVGTTLGLYAYNAPKDSFDPVPGFSGIFVTDIDEDRNGYLWVSTYARGLISYDLHFGRIAGRYEFDSGASSVPSNKLFSVVAGTGGKIWSASFNSGFCSLNTDTGEIRTYNTASCKDLHTNICFQILEDQNQTIWVSTDKGLFSLNPATARIHHFSVNDGLLNNDFKNCGFKDKNGDLYFGSRSGFIRFNPSHFSSATRAPKLVLSDFLIGDQVIGGGQAPLCGGIDQARRIRLTSRQNSFGFHFALLESPSPGFHSIEYKLAGYDKEWKDAPDNAAYFHKLRPGHYTFKLRCRVGEETLSHPDLELVIVPPFYRSVTAMGLYLVLILLGAAAVSALKKKRKEEKEKLQKIEEYQKEAESAKAAVRKLRNELLKTPAREAQSLKTGLPKLELHGDDEEFLRKLDEVVFRNLQDPGFTSSQIGQDLFVSHSTLTRKMKELLETTPSDYLRKKRLQIAAQLLGQKKYRVSEVCFAVGFNSPSYFTKCFKEQYGVLPGDFEAM